MNFAGGSKLQTTGKIEEAKLETSKPAALSSGAQDAKTDSDSLSTSSLAALQSDVQPVGHDYVEEVRHLAGGNIYILNSI